MKTSCLSVVVSSVAALLFVSPSASAQQLLRQHDNGFGLAAAGIPDVDGDGVRDYALSDVTDRERVRVFSGATGVELFKITGGQAARTSFGTVLCSAGDIDGDGVDDLCIGAPGYVDPSQTFVDCGAIFVASGVDGHMLHKSFGSADSDTLGTSVAGLGDVDGDGFSDYLAGAPQVLPMGKGRLGYVRCYSGATGLMLYQVDGAIGDGGFGSGIALLFDHDGDGVRDFAVVSALNTRICSGATGATIATIPCPAYVNLGGVCEVDDIDGDGEPEVAVGDIASSINTDGEVRLFSIATQTQLRLHYGSDSIASFGMTIASIADADGDGVRDYLVGEQALYNSGSASLYSGRTGERLYRFIDPLTPMYMGIAVADAGDLDGDGRSELLVGSPDDLDVNGRVGATFVFRGNDLWLNAESKQPSAGAFESIETHGAPTGSPVALFLIDVGGTPMPRLLTLGVSDSVEAFLVQGAVPSGLAGVTITLRSYALDLSGHLMTSADELVQFQ